MIYFPKWQRILTYSLLNLDPQPYRKGSRHTWIWIRMSDNILYLPRTTKNSLKMININDPVNNQDLHSTKQDKSNKQAITQWVCIWRHFRKYSESFSIGMN